MHVSFFAWILNIHLNYTDDDDDDDDDDYRNSDRNVLVSE